jgi:thiol:disulfide interchange protein DsbD
MRFSVFALLLAFPFAAHALESPAASTARDSASLVSEADTFTPGKPLRLGLHLKIAPGWHTYWSNPGDAGAPPTLDITGAPAGPITFPTPERLIDGPFTSYAYTGDLLLPLTIAPPATAKTLAIEAHATWLVCANVCVPEEASFHLTLPAGEAAPGAQAPLFAAADARTPRPSPFAAHVTPEGKLWFDAPKLSLRAALFFPADAGVIDQGAPQQLTVTPDRFTLALKPLKTPLQNLAGVLSLTDTGGQVENLAITATQMALPAQAVAPDAPPGLARALLLAFAGGLILNLMPCVLPVLAIKALAVARLSGAARAHVRRDAAFYTLGVLVTFCALGAAIMGIRALGGQADWGVQFQSAAFTTGMAALLLAIGLNMSGVFMVGGALAGAGQNFAARGAFFTGLLAVVVATPCTAPFMGVALTAALAMPPLAAMLIFVALGAGLAAPYAALALNPAAARLLPRPGAWMDTLKHLLAFPMYGAALWMVWVVSQQTGPGGLAASFAALLLVAFAAWAYGYGQTHGAPRLLNGAALASLLGAAAFIWVASGAGAPAVAAAGGLAADGSEPFSEARLASLRAEHRPVLVDMSAAWCVTCLVNERVALAPQSVRDAFAQHKVAYLKGDWTRQDPAITAFLRQYDRSGVPLYVFFPADGPGEVLPQILTPGIVLAHLAA